MRSVLLLLLVSAPAAAGPPPAPCPPQAPPVRTPENGCPCATCPDPYCPTGRATNPCPCVVPPRPAWAGQTVTYWQTADGAIVTYPRGVTPAFTYPPAAGAGRGFYMAYPSVGGGCPGGVCPR